MRQALDQAGTHRVGGYRNDDRESRGRLLRRERGGRRYCDNDIDPAGGQLARQLRQPLELEIGGTQLDRDIPPFDIAELAQPIAELLADPRPRGQISDPR